MDGHERSYPRIDDERKISPDCRSLLDCYKNIQNGYRKVCLDEDG